MSGTNNAFIRKIFSFYLFLSSRARYVLTLDLFMLCFSVYLAYSLRLTFFITQGYVKELFITMVVFSCCVIGSFILGGVHKIVWTRASIEEYTDLFKWYVVGSLIFLGLLQFGHITRIPRSSLVLMLLMGISSITGVRALWKLIFVSRRTECQASKRTLIIGAFT